MTNKKIEKLENDFGIPSVFYINFNKEVQERYNEMHDKLNEVIDAVNELPSSHQWIPYQWEDRSYVVEGEGAEKARRLGAGLPMRHSEVVTKLLCVVCREKKTV